MNRVVEVMKSELEVEFQQKGREYFEKTAKDFIRQLKPRLQKIQTMLEDLGLIMDQTLLEQALVAAVSAFEVYLRELAVSIVALNPRVRKRFHTEIGEELSVSKLEEYGQDAKRAQAEIVADLVKLDINAIKSLVDRLLHLVDVFIDRRTELRVSKIFATRHIIIHQAGFIDPRFKRITKSKSAIDKQIKLSRRFVLNSIRILKDIVQRIEKHIHQASSLNVECKKNSNQDRT
jgi:hypothetical protein